MKTDPVLKVDAVGFQKFCTKLLDSAEFPQVMKLASKEGSITWFLLWFGSSCFSVLLMSC